MTNDREDRFELKLGKIRSAGSTKRARSFLSRVARSTSRAGPQGRGRSIGTRRSQARQFSRRVIIKTRIIRMSASSAGALTAHLGYIKRDSALSENDRGQLFGASDERANLRRFADDVAGDRHHFRMIVSPEDGAMMSDLKPFVRDLMQQMETDLETRLDWVAAVHEDTGRPHAHIVLRGKREDGRDLVIPRQYVAHTMRERAEHLVTLELGPETALERDRKLAREVGAERLTRIDRHLFGSMDESGQVSLAASERYRQLHAARLKTLGTLGLATRINTARWQIADGAETTLKDLGARGDIIKTLNRELAGRPDGRIDAGSIFDKTNADAPILTGAIIGKGVAGEAHDRAYAIIDSMDGRSVYLDLGNADALDELRTGIIVQVTPPDFSPRASDRKIAAIAAQNGGVYSASLHQQAEPRSSPEFIAAHARRLEAMRRAGFAVRQKTGDWQITDNHLARASSYETAMAASRPVKMNVLSHLPWEEQVSAIGLTWLDDQSPTQMNVFGLAADVTKAAKARRQFLTEIGVLASPEMTLSEQQRTELVARDMDSAGQALQGDLGKPFTQAPVRGNIEGIFRSSITRPSGKFAVIERSRDFTLVPWRRALERNLGRNVSGMASNGNISWALTRKMGRTFD